MATFKNPSAMLLHCRSKMTEKFNKASILHMNFLHYWQREQIICSLILKGVRSSTYEVARLIKI